ncbi:MAG: iron ABC transporter permease [Hymenobacteraceae bacterium]|nr:iron ABC transporter permease [Hymenobacteraceae bacterium]
MRARLLLPLTLVGLLLLLLAGLRLGSYDTSWADLLRSLAHPGAAIGADPLAFVVWELRLPRLLLAAVAGGSLALSGYLLQATVANDLADPYLVGTAAGASVGAVASYALLPGGGWLWGLYMPPLAAFAGGLGATGLVLALGTRRGRLDPTTLILAGVAMSSLLGAVTGLLTFVASQSEGALRAVVFWAFGGFERADWQTLPYPAGALALGLLVALSRHRVLPLLLLGDERAASLGVTTGRERLLLLSTAALLTAATVALTGPIGFVGLLVPHAARRLLGAHHVAAPLLATGLGAVLLVGCDGVARLLYPPAGLPVGLVTSLVGVPFFLSLLRRK